MRDRVSTKILDNGAARYGVYDEDGKLLRYEYIKLEDEPDEEGDLFNKGNMLPDFIPALLGLKMANPQVKDALNVLANIGNVYVWSREPQGNYVIEPNLIEAEVFRYPYEDIETPNYDGWLYSDAIDVDINGNISMPGNATAIDINLLNFNNLGILKGKFIQNTYPGAFDFSLGGKIVYVPETASFISSADGSAYVITLDGYQEVKGVRNGETDFVISTDSTAYPQDGAVGDYHYTYLGQLGEPGAKIEVGSYVGTGTYGESNPNTITFDFAPKLVWIIGPSNGSFNVTNTPVLLIYDRTFYYNGNINNTTGTLNLGVTWGDKFVSYYYKSGFNGYEAVAQLNANGKTYSYIAIG